MDAHPDNAHGASRAICGLMMFEGDNALKKVSVLSGGEKSRVLLGKLLISPANMLILDEPTNHLDMESIDSLIEAIDAFDGAVIIVTHSEMILEAVATKLIVYDNDEVNIVEGTYFDFIERIGWQDEGGVRVKKPKGKRNDADKRRNRKDAKKLRSAVTAD
jgi:ATP-binding cassette subfamily F protein 3